MTADGPARLRFSRPFAVFVMMIASAVAAPLARRQAPPPPQQPVIRRDVGPSGAPGQSPLPPLSPDAQRLLEQLKQDQASIIDQLRFLQLSYRDAGHAEDAAAIAAHVRLLQQRTPLVSDTATAELVHEGLPTRDDPIHLSLFRHLTGDTLSFAILGRDDQPVWGTMTYTDDSGLETAAVHAGLLRAGQSGIVKVRVLPGLEKYEGSSQNGVQSSAFGPHKGSFRFMAAVVTIPNRSPSLSSYRDLVGQSITVPVVGAGLGSVWGSVVYTDDSSLAAAAVHAGVLAVGELGFVKVTLMPDQQHYEGSARNGVTSQTHETFGGAFRVEPAAQPWITQLPGGEDASRLIPMMTMRGHMDVSFTVQVKGTTAGVVWGSGIYTDDSSISAAAVHAGLIKPDEIGLVKVTLVPGRQSYPANEANGIKTQPWGQWEGSFRLERAVR